ncbi:MAG: hypothetical protein JST00_05900 [Deltaproteobacteria bacterium]|nr:hypothetical protein [Deltaproteobacteria bacterium]
MTRTFGAIFVLLVGGSGGCGEKAGEAVPPLTVAVVHELVPTGIEANVLAAEGKPKGRLVVGWTTPREEQLVLTGQASMQLVKDMIGRYTPGDEVDFAKVDRVKVRIDGAPPGAHPIVLLDVDHTFWPTVFGAGKGLVGRGPSGGGDVALRPNPVRPSVERCAGPRLKKIEVPSPGLPTPTRRFCAWLPASFDEANATKRYPIVLMLPGFMSTDTAYLTGNRHMGERADTITAETKREVVLVGVDTSVPLGSTYLEDSSANGPVATFFAGPALAAVEKAIHGIGKRTARALIGQSTGGHNALSFGMRRSDLFSVIGASSPDAPDMEMWLWGSRGEVGRVDESVRHWTWLEKELGGPGQMTSYAAEWSGGRWPFDPSTGAVDQAVLGTWVAKSPHGMLRDPAVVARLARDLSGRVMITVGRNDEFWLYPPAERFAKELEAKGIATRFVPTDHGHGDGVERLEAALRFALERLDER